MCPFWSISCSSPWKITQESFRSTEMSVRLVRFSFPLPNSQFSSLSLLNAIWSLRAAQCLLACCARKIGFDILHHMRMISWDVFRLKNSVKNDWDWSGESSFEGALNQIRESINGFRRLRWSLSTIWVYSTWKFNSFGWGLRKDYFEGLMWRVNCVLKVVQNDVLR